MTGHDELAPISALFFDDAGPHVVRAGFPTATANPKVTSRPAPKASPMTTPARGSELQALLNTSITQLGGVSGKVRRKTPAPLPPPVPIDTLLYRGAAALDRALEIREDVLRLGGSPDRKTVDELLDLIALAATD